MPKLWEESIENHRHAVRSTIMEATWRLAEEHGPLGLSMSQVAKAAGIGRATLYKYFTDVGSILVAHHVEHVGAHLRHLEELRAGPGTVGSRVVVVVDAYATICFHRGRHSSTDVSALVHQGPELVDTEHRLRGIFAELIEEAAAQGLVRADLDPTELAEFCLHALSAAGRAADLDQVARLVQVVLDGLGCPLGVHREDRGAGSADARPHRAPSAHDAADGPVPHRH